MNSFRKHIALFFCLLFLASQASYVFHNFSEPHNHNHYATLDSNGITITHLAIENTEFTTAVYDCLLCHQFKLTKVVVTYENKLQIVKPTLTHYSKIEYVEPYTFLYLLSNSSLRAPPTIALAV